MFTSSSGLYDWLFHIVRIFFDPFEAVGYPEQGFIGIRTNFKQQADIGGAVLALTFNLYQAFEIFEFILLNIRDFPFHFNGAGAPPGGRNGDFWKINIGGQLNRDSKKGNKPKENQQKNAYRNGHRFFYGCADKFHNMLQDAGFKIQDKRQSIR